MVFRKELQFLSKTVGVIFSPYRSQHQSVLTIHVDNLIASFVNQTKYLDGLLDSLFNLNNHTENIMRSANQAIKITKCLAGKDWSADRKILRLFYAAAVRLRIEYFFLVLMGISAKNFKKLEVLQNQALRIMAGAMKSTCIPAIRIETGIMSIKSRVHHLAPKYILKVIKISNHPNQQLIEISKGYIERTSNWENEPPIIPKLINMIEGFGLNLIFLEAKKATSNQQAENLRIKLKIEPKCSRSDLTPLKKLRLLQTLDSCYSNHFFYYTDGSKIGIKVGFAIWSEETNEILQECLYELASVFAAEILAIKKALMQIELEYTNGENAVILSDSKSAITAIHSRKILDVNYL